MGLRHYQLAECTNEHHAGTDPQPYPRLSKSMIPAFVSSFSLLPLQLFYGVTAQPVGAATVHPCGDFSPFSCTKCVLARDSFALVLAGLIFPATCVPSLRVLPGL